MFEVIIDMQVRNRWNTVTYYSVIQAQLHRLFHKWHLCKDCADGQYVPFCPITKASRLILLIEVTQVCCNNRDTNIVLCRSQTFLTLGAVLSLKLSEFTVWRHTWRKKKWIYYAIFDRQYRRPQNCPFQSSFTHRTAQFTHRIPQFPQFTCPHHDGIISRHIRF